MCTKVQLLRGSHVAENDGVVGKSPADNLVSRLTLAFNASKGIWKIEGNVYSSVG